MALDCGWASFDHGRRNRGGGGIGVLFGEPLNSLGDAALVSGLLAHLMDRPDLLPHVHAVSLFSAKT